MLTKAVGAKRRFFIFFSCLVFSLILSNNYLFTVQLDNSDSLYDIHPEWFDNSSQSCFLPLHIDPFDQTILPFIQKLPSTIKCPLNRKSRFDRLYQLKDHRSYTFMKDDDPIVRIMKIKGYKEAIKCFYKSFQRKPLSDDELVYGEEKPIIGHKLDLEKLGSEYVVVRCEYNGDTVYQNIHHWPTKMPTSKTNSTADQPSVLIFVVESLSYFNFKRFMPQTENQLSKLSNNHILRGLVKLADNTFPNMVPLLVGKFLNN